MEKTELGEWYKYLDRQCYNDIDMSETRKRISQICRLAGQLSKKLQKRKKRGGFKIKDGKVQSYKRIK